LHEVTDLTRIWIDRDVVERLRADPQRPVTVDAEHAVPDHVALAAVELETTRRIDEHRGGDLGRRPAFEADTDDRRFVVGPTIVGSGNDAADLLDRATLGAVSAEPASGSEEPAVANDSSESVNSRTSSAVGGRERRAKRSSSPWRA